MVDGKIYTSYLNVANLPDLTTQVMQLLHYGHQPEPYLADLASSLLESSREYCQIRIGYKTIQNTSIAVDKDAMIVFPKVKFACGRIIAKQLKGLQGVAIFTCTLGHQFDTWFKTFFNNGDPVSGYIADLVGSVMVEAAADVLEDKIRSDLKKKDYHCSNRYSPGYCGWDVAEQKELFSLLPKDFCGIKLSASALMTPIKSVSGVIGFGRSVIKRQYACRICTQENCYMRSLKESA